MQDAHVGFLLHRRGQIGHQALLVGIGDRQRQQPVAVALGRHGIRCNSVLPGTIATDINKDDLADPKKREYMEGRIPLGRLGRPEDIASVVAFLSSDMASYMSGAALLVDGGAFANFQ